MVKVYDYPGYGKPGDTPAAVETMTKQVQDMLKKAQQSFDDDIYGSAIPYMYGQSGGFLVNPSSVAITTCQKMAYSDSVISACLEFMIAMISGSIGEYTHPVKEIELLIRGVLENLQYGGFPGLLKNLCTAFWAGFAIGEKVYDYDRRQGKVTIKQVLPYPPSTVFFAVDGDGNLVDWVYQYVINTIYPGYQNANGYLSITNQGNTFPPDPNSALGDVDYPIRSITYQPYGMVAVPRENLVHYVVKGVDGLQNPFGRSMLRRAHQYWMYKQALWISLLLMAERKGSPLLVVYCEATAAIKTSPMDTTPTDPLTVAYQAFAQMQQNSALILPGLKGKIYDVDKVDVSGDLTRFIDVINAIDSYLSISMLSPPITRQEDASYASSTSQNSMYAQILTSMKNDIKHVIIHDIVKDLIQKNFSDSVHQWDWGCFGDKILSVDDQLKYVKIYESGKQTGIISSSHMSDLNSMRQNLGFSEMSESEMKEMQSELEKAVQSSGDNAQQKMNPEEAKPHYKKTSSGEI